MHASMHYSAFDARLCHDLWGKVCTGTPVLNKKDGSPMIELSSHLDFVIQIIGAALTDVAQAPVALHH